MYLWLCGALVQNPRGDCIIPTHAYRDEGVSYHYAPASDYINVKNANVIAKLFDKLGVEYIFGKHGQQIDIVRRWIRKISVLKRAVSV